MVEGARNSDDNPERPSDDELDRMYKRLLDELNIPESKRGSMLAQPMHMKWKLLSKHQRYVRVQSSSYGNFGGAVRSVEILNRILVNAERPGGLSASSDLVDFRVEIKEDSDWVQVFLELGGVKKVVEILDIAAARKDTRAQCDLLECLVVLIKGNVGTLSLVLDEFDAVTIIGACLPSVEAIISSSGENKLALAVLNVLNMITRHSADGHVAVLDALHVLRMENHQAMTFGSLVNLLASDQSLETSLKTNVIKLLNSIVQGVERLEDRVAMRGDLAYLGLLGALDDLEGMVELLSSEACEEREDLDKLICQVRVFRNSGAKDNAAVVAAAPNTGCWLADPDMVFANVQDRARGAGTAKELVQILHACLVIPRNAPMLAPGVWRLLAETCQRIVANPDACRMTFSQVEQNYLDADTRYHALQSDTKRVAELEQELAKTKRQLLDLEKRQQQQQQQQQQDKKEELGPAAVLSAALATRNASRKEEEDKNKIMGKDKETTTSKEMKKFEKYARMKKAGLPELAIVNSMTKDGVSKDDQDVYFGRNNKNNKTSEKDDPRFEKYNKMLKHGLPEGAVRVQMAKDGLPKSEQSQFFNKQPSGEEEEEEESKEEEENLKDDPKFAKYYKMRTAGLPQGAIINAMCRDELSAQDQDRFLGRRSGKQQKPKKDAFPSKAKIEQRKPMRALFWSKLANDSVQGTVWLDLDDKDVELDLDTLESGFALAAAASKSNNDSNNSNTCSTTRTTTSKQGKTNIQDKKPVELIDPSRRQNVGIAFARLKMSPQMLKACILDMDLRRLGGGMDRVKLLKSLLPNAEEQGVLKEYSGDKEQLGKIEQLFLELGSVSNIHDIIRAWEIQLGFKQRVAETREMVETFSKACLQVKESAALKQLLKVVLKVGNYLNGTSARGGAYGFKLDILNKIGTVKAADGSKSTLLTYIVKEIAEKRYPAITRLPKELEHAEHAHRISVTALMQDCKEHGRDLKFLEKVLEEEQKRQPETLGFAGKTQQFLLGAQKSLGHLELATEKANKMYESLLKVLTPGDEEFAASSEKFFQLFHQFVQAFKRELTPPDEKQRRKSHNQRTLDNSNQKPATKPVQEMSSAHSVLAEIKTRKGKASLTGRVRPTQKSAPSKPVTILDQIRARAQS